MWQRRWQVQTTSPRGFVLFGVFYVPGNYNYMSLAVAHCKADKTVLYTWYCLRMLEVASQPLSTPDASYRFREGRKREQAGEVVTV